MLPLLANINFNDALNNQCMEYNLQDLKFIVDDLLSWQISAICPLALELKVIG